MPSSAENHCSGDSVRSDIKSFLCTLCAGSLKFQDGPVIQGQEQSRLQTEVSRTVILGSDKYSGVFRQHYCYACNVR